MFLHDSIQSPNRSKVWFNCNFSVLCLLHINELYARLYLYPTHCASTNGGSVFWSSMPVAINDMCIHWSTNFTSMTAIGIIIIDAAILITCTHSNLSTTIILIHLKIKNKESISIIKCIQLILQEKGNMSNVVRHDTSKLMSRLVWPMSWKFRAIEDKPYCVDFHLGAKTNTCKSGLQFNPYYVLWPFSHVFYLYCCYWTESK